MRTTIVLDDNLLKKARVRALRDGETLSGLIERALRLMMDAAGKPAPRYRADIKCRSAEPLGGIDWSDRDALYNRMEDRT
jgi:hypothetical protein